MYANEAGSFFFGVLYSIAFRVSLWKLCGVFSEVSGWRD